MKQPKPQHIKLINDDKSINLHNLESVLLSVNYDAIKLSKGNCSAARRFRVNTVMLEQAFKVMRENSPIKYYSKNKKHLGRS